MLRVISLGAGVQSSTMALMFAHGEIEPMPDCAIFADTGGEPAHVYKYLDWLETQLPFPVLRVMGGNGLKRNVIDSATQNVRSAQPPFFTAGGGMLRRNCTSEFKVKPIIRKMRELVGLRPRQRAKGVLAIQYLGISYDESIRMKPSRDKWIEHRWPLVEREIRRGDCLQWMKDRGYPEPGRSACTFCPYHSDSEWRDLKVNYPADFQDAVKIDRLIRGGVRGSKEKLYLHRSRQPLETIDFSSPGDMGQQSLWGEECEGLCGV